MCGARWRINRRSGSVTAMTTTPQIAVTTESRRRFGRLGLVITRTGTPGRWVKRTRVVWR
jgi:hypothetical protein